MKELVKIRLASHVSQRGLAEKAGISYKSLQLIEAGGHDPKLSTLTKIAGALRYPKKTFTQYILDFFKMPQDSVAIASRQIAESKTSDWRIPFFNFVDAFRTHKNAVLVLMPPYHGLKTSLTALFASTTEALCGELGLVPPPWCLGVLPLAEPYFVSEIQNLKATALVESPVYFRKRNIFVMADFLKRV
ncbi:MAG: helix-turn-helix transcriptional regulator [Deltaproteobacteria bacterium]|nr:helix-turn-helix transcriptional regulator [Deltaproteobacteria bacterium]